MNIIRKIKEIDFQKVIWVLLGLYFVLNNIMEHSLYFQVFGLLFVTVTALYLLFTRSIKINKYFVVLIVFYLYQILLVVFNVAAYPEHSLSIIAIVCKNLVVAILIYSFLVKENQTERILKLYIKASLVSVLFYYIIYRNVIFQGRFAFYNGDQVTNAYSLFGITVTPANSNGIAYFCGIAFILSTLYFIKQKKKVYLAFDMIFILTIFISGSRKGIAILAIGLLFTYFIVSKKKITLPSILFSILGVLVIYYLIMTVPGLYNIVGERTQSLINYVLGKGVHESSLGTRLKLIQMAKDYFKLRPVLGYGLDAFRIMCPLGMVTDNNFWEMLVSGGIAGFLIYYSYLPMAVYEYFSIRNKSDELKIIFFILLVTIVLQIGSVTYLERLFDFTNILLFYILHSSKANGSMTSLAWSDSSC